MARLHPKVHRAADGSHYLYHCPGCGHFHAMWVTRPNKLGHQWQFNGDIYYPTFHPALKALIRNHENKIIQCHHQVQKGKLIFLSDCTHSLKGQTVDMLPIHLS